MFLCQNCGSKAPPVMALEEICDRWQVRPAGIIHLGAHVGQELPLYTAWKPAKVAWVEANPDLIPELQRNVSPYAGHTVHEAAVWSSDDDSLPFYVASNGGSSSLLRMKLHLERYPEVLVDRTIQRRTSSVDGLMKRSGLRPSDFDFLNMDLQGAEGDVIDGMAEQAKHLRWIYTEVSFEELYAGSWPFEWVYGKLRRLGFGLLECRQVGLGWGEALFQREE